LEIKSFVNDMRRIIKKEINLNELRKGCSPCLNEAKKMQNRILKRNISKIDTNEFKKIVSSMFKKNKV
tara:strand:+ start:699 stop:902 length:204 start_codon:yes stop_codon:yes gene_type:complete